MNGLLYKNIIQNKFFLLLTAFLPPVIICLFIVFLVDFENGFSAAAFKDSLSQYASSGIIIRSVLYFLCFFITIVIQNSIISIDEMKKWSYFISSTPDGVKKQVYSKYLMIFITLEICLVSAYLTDSAHCVVTAIVVNETLPQLTSMFSFMFYIILLYFAFDIPFSIRFGVKKGAAVKCVILAAVLFGVVVYLLFGPLPNESGAIIDAIFGTVEKIVNNELSDEMILVMGILPVVSVIGYVTSYFISCRLYMKGVEEYAK